MVAHRTHQRTNLLFYGVLFALAVAFCAGRFLILHVPDYRDSAPSSITLHNVRPAREGLLVHTVPTPAEQETFTIRGSVRMPEGTPHDETLRVEAVQGEARTRATALVEADGSFSLSLPASPDPLELDIVGRFLFLDFPLEVTPSAASTRVELRPKLGALVSVRFEGDHAQLDLDPDRLDLSILPRLEGDEPKPLHSTWNRLKIGDRVLLDDAGYELRAVPTPGAWDMALLVDGFRPRSLTVADLQPGEHRHLVVDLERGAQVRGQVLDPSGAPLAGARIQGRALGQKASDGHRPIVTLSAEDGSFTLDGMANESLVSASLAGYLAGTETEVRIARQEQEGTAPPPVTLVLRRGHGIGGRLVWEDGEGVAGETVLAWAMESHDDLNPTGAPRSATTDGDGYFRVEGLEEGRFVLRAEVERQTGVNRYASASIQAADVRAGSEGLELVLKQRAALFGLVLDRAGGQLPGFEVHALSRGEDSADRKVVHPLDGVDGPFEMASFGPGEWEFHIEAPGFLPSPPQVVSLPHGDLTNPVRFVLSSAGAVRGLVLDPDGEPMPGTSLRRTASGVWRRGTRCDVHGRFHLTDLEAGTVELVAEAEGYVASEPARLELAAGALEEGLVLRLRRGGILTGRVLDASGQPVVGAEVHAARREPSMHRTQVTDDTGGFRLDALQPGSWEVWTLGEVPEEGVGLASWLSNQAELVEGEETFVVLGTPATKPVRILGSVHSGNRPRRASVLFEPEGEGRGAGVQLTLAGEDGEFRVRLERPGAYVVTVQPFGGRAASIRFPIEVPDALEHRLELSLPIGRLAGQVISESGEPMAGAEVVLMATGLQPNLLQTSGSPRVHTDQDGRYAFGDLHPGTYAARLLPSPDPISGLSSGILVREEIQVTGQLEQVDFRPAPGERFAGRVLDEKGSAVPGASIFVRLASGGYLERRSTLVSDRDGRFVGPALAPGTYTLFARSATGESRESAPFEIRPGERPERELVIHPGGFLSLHGSPEHGSPSMAHLSVTDGQGREVHGITGPWTLNQDWTAAQSVSVGPLSPGLYRIRARLADGLQLERHVRLEAGRTVEVRLGDEEGASPLLP